MSEPMTMAEFFAEAKRLKCRIISDDPNDIRATLDAKDTEIERLQRDNLKHEAALAEDHLTIERLNARLGTEQDQTYWKTRYDRLKAELAAVKAKHYEECAVICDGSHIKPGYWYAAEIRAALQPK